MYCIWLYMAGTNRSTNWFWQNHHVAGLGNTFGANVVNTKSTKYNRRNQTGSPAALMHLDRPPVAPNWPDCFFVKYTDSVSSPSCSWKAHSGPKEREASCRGTGCPPPALHGRTQQAVWGAQRKVWRGQGHTTEFCLNWTDIGVNLNVYLFVKLR